MELNYLRSSVDTCSFYHPQKVSFIPVYVDDMIIFDVDENSVQKLIANFGEWIRIENKGVPEWFLGIKIQVGEKRIKLSQERYVKNSIKKWNMHNCKPVYEPVVTSKNATDDKCLINRSLFQQLVGTFSYLAVTTRPDIAFAVSLLSQACKNPTVQDFIAAKRVLRYLKDTNYFLFYSRHDNGLGVFAYSDAGWARDVNTRKSVSGMVIKLNESDSPVFWLNNVRFHYLHVNRNIWLYRPWLRKFCS